MPAILFASKWRRLPTAFYGFLTLLFGCSTTPASPGMTLLAGLNYYREEMRRLEQQPERWPDRQGLSDSLKAQYGIIIGRSAEFDRLVDLDGKKREFALTLREPSLKPDRAR